MPLGADHAGQIPIQHGMDTRRIKRRAGAVDKGRDAVFFGLRRVVGKAVKFLGPHRMRVCRVEIKEAGVKDRLCLHPRAVRLDHPRIGVQRPDDLARRVISRGA